MTDVTRGTRPLRRVVVTGGAGFLGSHLCTRLVSEDVEVVCLDNLLTGDPANLGHLQGDPRFRFIRCDVTDFVRVSAPSRPCCTSRHLRRPSTTSNCPSRPSRSAAWALCTRSGSPRCPGRRVWLAPPSGSSPRPLRPEVEIGDGGHHVGDAYRQEPRIRSAGRRHPG